MLALSCICKRRGFLCHGSCILDLYMGTDRQRLLLMMMVFIYIDDTSRHDIGHLEIYSKVTNIFDIHEHDIHVHLSETTSIHYKI